MKTDKILLLMFFYEQELKEANKKLDMKRVEALEVCIEIVYLEIMHRDNNKYFNFNKIKNEQTIKSE